MIFLALKTEDGRISGNNSFYCRILGIGRQGFYKYLANKDRPWKYHIHQSMNSAGGRCHNNAPCESIWARMKTELLYDRYDTKQMNVEE